jgi:hypothetical protein
VTPLPPFLTKIVPHFQHDQHSKGAWRSGNALAGF